MATTADWSALAPNIITRYFATGDAADWCVHTIPAWARAVTIYNHGATDLEVMIPGAAGTRAATDHFTVVPTLQGATFYYGDRSKPTILTFGTFGNDGAAHVIRITFEAQ